MIKLTQLQNYIMTKVIHVSDPVHKKYKKIAVDEDITIQEALERDLP